MSFLPYKKRQAKKSSSRNKRVQEVYFSDIRSAVSSGGSTLKPRVRDKRKYDFSEDLEWYGGTPSSASSSGLKDDKDWYG